MTGRTKALLAGIAGIVLGAAIFHVSQEQARMRLASNYFITPQDVNRAAAEAYPGMLFGGVIAGAGGLVLLGLLLTTKKYEDLDVEVEVEVEPEQARNGTDKVISFSRRRDGATGRATLVVPVPPGVQTGQRLRLRGEGHSSTQGAGHGNLAVTIKVVAAKSGAA